jgi:hypothetical protein
VTKYYAKCGVCGLSWPLSDLVGIGQAKVAKVVPVTWEYVSW